MGTELIRYSFPERGGRLEFGTDAWTWKMGVGGGGINWPKTRKKVLLNFEQEKKNAWQGSFLTPNLISHFFYLKIDFEKKSSYPWLTLTIFSYNLTNNFCFQISSASVTTPPPPLFWPHFCCSQKRDVLLFERTCELKKKGYTREISIGLLKKN